MPAEVKSIVFAAAASQGGYVPGYYMQPGFQAPQPALPTQQSLAGYLASYQGWGMLVGTGTIHQLASDQGWGCWMVLSTLHLIASPIQDCRWYLILEILHHHGLAQNLPDLMFRRVMMKTLLQVTGLHCEGLGTTHTDCIRLWAIRVIHIISPWT